MRTIISGTSMERLLRAGLLMVLVDVFTLLFLWDGYVGYARDNASELSRLLGLGADRQLAVDRRLTADRATAMAKQVPPGEPADAVMRMLGEPAAIHDDDLYYLGPGGWLRVEVTAGRAGQSHWKTAGHSESDQRWQRWIGYVLGLIGIYALVQFARTAATRAALSDEGLSINGRACIPWEAITALRAAPGSRDAIELDYTIGDARHTLRMDRYGYKDMAAICSAIAGRRGFEDPLSRRMEESEPSERGGAL